VLSQLTTVTRIPNVRDRFFLDLPISGPLTKTTVALIEPTGDVQVDSVSIEIPNWDAVEWQLKNGRPKARRVRLDVGLSTLTFNQVDETGSAIANFMDLNPRVHMIWRAPLGKRWMAMTDLNLLPIAITRNAPATYMLLELGLGAQYEFVRRVSGWLMALGGGAHYVSLLGASFTFGFLHLIGPEVTFSVRKHLSPKWEPEIAIRYAMPIPSVSAISLANRVLGIGVVVNDNRNRPWRLSYGFEFTNGYASVDSNTISFTTLGLTVGARL
jgi:hypothetical protein